MTFDLAALGWNDRLAADFVPHRAEGLVPARVALEHTHIYRVLSESGEWLARVSGRLRHHAATRVDFLAVGDWVAIEPPTDSGDARIRAVLPRSSRFSRRAAGNPTEEQIVAANIDVVFLVSGLDGDFNPRRIERYLVVAGDSGATPVIILNKADLIDDVNAVVPDVRSMAPGVDVHAVSCRQPESLDALRRYLGFGRTGALLGSSGVGKSSIVNQLIGYDLLRTRDVRVSDSRGRHASTSRQLVMLPGGGVLIDTPGMRELQPWADTQAVDAAFEDIADIAAACRFGDCTHTTEPGCAVLARAADGTISADRLENYRKLLRELAFEERKHDKAASANIKRRWKQIHKAQRDMYKVKDKM
jgi:ribosome biogenesis GTPase / thiamine phosphate phosphatase